MSVAEPITIIDIKGLLDWMQRSQLWVEWRVRGDIGPDWIGSDCNVQFYLDQQPLAATRFHQVLQQILIEAIHIPTSRTHTVISGEAEVRLDNGWLIAEWEWTESVPYQYPRSSGHGTTALVDVAQLQKQLARDDAAKASEGCNFMLRMADAEQLVAQLTLGPHTYDIQLARDLWTANDYLAHWGFTAYDLLDDYRTKFLILEARPTRSPQPLRAFRVSRIANRFHFHDVLIQAPIAVGGYSGESFIQWLNRPHAPMLVSERQRHCDRIADFIVGMAAFERWHVDYLDPHAPDEHRPIDELVTYGDWA